MVLACTRPTPSQYLRSSDERARQYPGPGSAMVSLHPHLQLLQVSLQLLLVVLQLLLEVTLVAVDAVSCRLKLNLQAREIEEGMHCRVWDVLFVKWSPSLSAGLYLTYLCLCLSTHPCVQTAYDIVPVGLASGRTALHMHA